MVLLREDRSKGRERAAVLARRPDVDLTPGNAPAGVRDMPATPLRLLPELQPCPADAGQAAVRTQKTA